MVVILLSCNVGAIHTSRPPMRDSPIFGSAPYLSQPPVRVSPCSSQPPIQLRPEPCDRAHIVNDSVNPGTSTAGRTHASMHNWVVYQRGSKEKNSSAARSRVFTRLQLSAIFCRNLPQSAVFCQYRKTPPESALITT